MFNRETGKTRQSSPMGGTPRPQRDDLVNRTYTPRQSKAEELVDRLVTAYNSKAMANPVTPLVSNYNSPADSTMSAWSHGGDRLGFATRHRIPDADLPDTRYTTRYGAGIDNFPLTGNSDNEINTLLGTLDYGHEGDTAYAGFTPNLERTRDYYTGGDGQPWSMDYARSNIGDATLQAGKYGNPADPSYFAGAILPGEEQYIPDYYRALNTPLGNLELETNYDFPNTLDATLTPNDRTRQYIQALQNLLNR